MAKNKQQSSYVSHALREFQSLGWLDAEGRYSDGAQRRICEHVLALLGVFSARVLSAAVNRMKEWL